MRNTIVACFAAGLAAQALADADRYTVDPRHTLPVFEVGHLGFSTQRGRFNRVTGAVVIDQEARRGSIDIEIDTTSLDMGAADWDREMKSEDFFAADAYPVARFKSDRLIFDGDTLVGADGELLLLGVAKPLHLKVDRFRCGIHPLLRKTVCGADVSATLRRSDFGMTRYLPMIGDEVRIVSPVEAVKD